MPLTRPALGWDALLTRMFAATQLQQVSAEQIQALSTWLDLVVHWNAQLDLTAARDAESLLDLCIADAALISAQVSRADPQAGSARWLDVGSGAGAPGLPLAILQPQVQMLLAEPKTKRAAFLRTVVGSLRARHINVERKRDVELSPLCCDVAISRATLAPLDWLKSGARLAAQDVWVLLAQAEAPQLPDYEVVGDLNYVWPFTQAPRRALCFRRKSSGV